MQFAKIAGIDGGFDMEKNYNLKEAAYLLGITVRTAREWVHNGKMKAKKYVVKGVYGKGWYVNENEIKRIQSEME